MTKLSGLPAINKADVIAGISVAGLMLPEAVAYAGIAGLPPHRAILAGIAGCLVYAIFGRSRFAIVSPTSSSAAILAATLAIVPGDATVKAGLATVAVALAGILFVIAAALRLGGITGFISRPVLRGFALGLAITIILHQLPILVGASVQGSNIFSYAAALFAAIPQWNPVSVAVGVVALAALLLVKRLPGIPGAFLVLAAGILSSFVLDLAGHGVKLVGTIEVLPQWPSLPDAGWVAYSRLAQFTVPLVLILFAESWGTMRALALRYGDTLAVNRELGALGFANIASAVVQGMPVGAGFSAGFASEAAGAKTRATAVFAAIGLAILIACAGPLVARLPEPVLAAVVIAALTHALDPSPILRLRRLHRDFYVALGATAGVLIFGVLNGMLLAIALSLAAMMHRLASPYIARLGRLGSSHNFVDLSRHQEASETPGVAIWRPGEPLFFGNADTIFGEILSRSRGEAGIRAVVLSLEESSDLDSTALDALMEFDGAMRVAGIRLQFARVHDRVRDLMTAAGMADVDGCCSFSVDDAIAAVGQAAKSSAAQSDSSQ
ncbi:SulP family inorganic anion transporter [Agrobacterium rhizogenes]|uniref:SulP family inorganic anion transporter n=1 Tax=Rhizobium rhizogenes TaxID=359 RepID=UPI001571D1A3|nr:SulP family inorganic anion transporter [Rhizobium rhizogenes]NTG72142.1 SulP family inorganic anion transporter [Rhizobium rhizogenes]NTI14326.1 SulP family inorganic anion transporter [Rhizobium rhizogenes]